MNFKLVIAATLAALIAAAAEPCLAEDVVIKVWSRADRSGPLRAGNIVAAGDTLNKMLAAINSDKRVKIELNETNAKGYDDDALDLLKAFAVDKGPDIFVLAHEWTGAFAEAGYAWNLDDFIAKNPELFGDIIKPLWQSVTYKGARYGVPQDSEVRMFFLNNDKLRKLGKTDKDIAALPAKVDAGEFTAYDLCDLAGQAVQKGVVKYGILHRPNAGPDFQMMMESFGLVPYDKAYEAGKGLVERLRKRIPRQQYDDAATAAKTAAESWRELARGSRVEDVHAAQAALDQADQRLAFLLRQSQEAVVKAPADGLGPGVRYEVIKHPEAFTAQEEAARAHVSGWTWVKTIVVKDPVGLALHVERDRAVVGELGGVGEQVEEGLANLRLIRVHHTQIVGALDHERVARGELFLDMGGRRAEVGDHLDPVPDDRVDLHPAQLARGLRKGRATIAACVVLGIVAGAGLGLAATKFVAEFRSTDPARTGRCARSATSSPRASA